MPPAEIWTVRAGQVPYEEARAAQKRLEAARHAGEVPDILLLLEHPPVYTKGRRSEPAELPMGEEWYRMQGIEVCDTDRGGRVTYHGPGQLVGYPIVSLRALGNRAAPASEPLARITGRPSGSLAEDAARDDVVEYIRRMERMVIAALADWGVRVGTIEGLTGVWTEGAPPGSPPEEGALPPSEARKIASIGIHVSRGVTTHGFAINVNNDLQPFEWIVPCGLEACRVTSVARELGAAQDMGRFMDSVRDRFGEIYQREPIEVEATELGAQVEGVAALAGAPPAAHVTGDGRPAPVR